MAAPTIALGTPGLVHLDALGSISFEGALRQLGRIARLTWVAMLGTAATSVVLLGLTLVASGNRLAVFSTPSMAPSLPVGAIVLLEDIDTDTTIHAGEIVTYREMTGTTVDTAHRLISVEQRADGTTLVQTKGDANPAPDTMMSADHLNQRVVSSWSGPAAMAADLAWSSFTAIGLLVGLALAAVANRFID